jgi:chemotaxis protein CheZ
MNKINDLIRPKELEQNLTALFRYVDRVRVEIASLNKSHDGDDKFETMGAQLDGVVEATREASDRIMDAIEKSNEACLKLRESTLQPDQTDLVDTIVANNNVVFEACAFQDITGQRVTKIVKSVSYVEERVSALRSIWGDDELDELVAGIEDTRTDDEKLLNGPQAASEAISQDEIDKLFE